MATTVTGVVCCNVEVVPDTGLELMKVKRGLAQAAKSVGSVQISSDSNPERAYANGSGFSLLKSLKAMETKIQKLEAQGEEKQMRMDALEEEITVLRPLKDLAIGIRKRFFSTFLDAKGLGGMGGPAARNDENATAHSADVVIDVCLFKNSLIDYQTTFAMLYGLEWHKASGLLGYPHMITAMNQRATIVADKHATWNRETEFNDLVLWTQNVTLLELTEFQNDTLGKTRGKRLFLNVLRN